MAEQQPTFEKRAETSEEVTRKFGFDPGRSLRSGLVIEQCGERLRILSEMRDNGDGTVSWTEVHANRPPIIEQIARVRAER